jgi:hypothetical protein
MRTAAPEYIKARRMADKGWVRRNMRSLGRNRRHRACMRMRHELRKAAEKLHKETAAKDSSIAQTITQRLDAFLGRARQMFTRSATS